MDWGPPAKGAGVPCDFKADGREPVKGSASRLPLEVTDLELRGTPDLEYEFRMGVFGNLEQKLAA